MHTGKIPLPGQEKLNNIYNKTIDEATNDEIKKCEEVVKKW